MRDKPKPCTLYKRHKWVHVKNLTITKQKFSARGSTASFSYRGLYQCECGERKLGVQA